MQIESHGIEFVPESERHGHSRQLFTIWFSSNVQITAMIVGAFGVLAGLNLFWAFAAIILGTLIGAVFMAAHSAQGPHLGIPQMIQSRAQFGVLGAALPLILTLLAFICFVAANGVIVRASIREIVPVSDNGAIILFQIATFIVAFIGYELIHRLGTWMTILSLLLFAAVAVALSRLPYPAHSFSWSHGLRGVAFVMALTQACSWSLGYGPYVADYSRYLPSDTPSSSTFIYSYLGQAVGCCFVMMIGAALAVQFIDIVANPGLRIASLFGPAAPVVAALVTLGVLMMNIMNLYSAYMSGATSFSGFHKMTKLGIKTKFIGMAAIMVISTIIAIATQYNFNDYFSNILIGQFYFLVPWTSINLTDYYLVRKGHYVVGDLYNEDGVYGRYNRGTLAIFALSVVAQVPTMQLSFFEGPVARLIGTDVSWVIGLFLPAALYLAASRMAGLGGDLHPSANLPADTPSIA